METKKFDEFVSDIFFDEAVDDKVMVASSGEGIFASIAFNKATILQFVVSKLSVLLQLETPC